MNAREVPCSNCRKMFYLSDCVKEEHPTCPSCELLSDPHAKPDITPKVREPEIALNFKRSSWANIFHVLNELGLGRSQSAGRQKAYFNEFGEYFSTGNFWAALHYLQTQFEKQTTLSSQQDYARAARGES